MTFRSANARIIELVNDPLIADDVCAYPADRQIASEASAASITAQGVTRSEATK